MDAVTALGELVPCHQLSGYYLQHGDFFGNVKRDGLRPHLQEGKCMCEVCTTLKQLKDANEVCAVCPVFSYCAGGCRAIALVVTDEKPGVDPAKCVFFREGYLEKMERAMAGYTSTKAEVYALIRDAFR